MMEVDASTYYKSEGFVECEVDIDWDDLVKAIEEYLWSNTDFDFEECEIHNDRPFGILLAAKLREYVNGDPDDPDHDTDIEADYETDNPYPEENRDDW